MRATKLLFEVDREGASGPALHTFLPPLEVAQKQGGGRRWGALTFRVVEARVQVLDDGRGVGALCLEAGGAGGQVLVPIEGAYVARQGREHGGEVDVAHGRELELGHIYRMVKCVFNSAAPPTKLGASAYTGRSCAPP